MVTFQEILEQNGIEFLDALMNNYLVVYTKKNCSVLSFMRCGEELKFFKGNDKEEITPLNIAIHNYFEEGINYIRRASSIFFREFPENWLFKLNYYPNVSTDVSAVGSNDNLLELSAMVSENGAIMKEEAMLSPWAERLGVGYVKPVFSGFLNEFQKSKLYAYIKEPVLNADVSFSAYIMSLLNPSVKPEDSEGYYFNFYKNGSKKATALKLIDPMIAALTKKTSGHDVTKDSNTSELVLLNFVCWLKTVDLDKYKVDGDDDDSRYLDLICKLFNDYIDAESAVYKSYIKESFNLINFDRITNDRTRELLKAHPQYQEPFQIIAGSFKAQKDIDYVNPTSLMNSEIVTSFNNEVDSIMKKVSVANMTQKEINPSKPHGVKDEPKAEVPEKFLTFLDFISQDKDSDYVKSMERAKDEDKPKHESKPEVKKDDSKSEEKKDDKKKDDKKKEGGEDKGKDKEEKKHEEKKDDSKPEEKKDDKKEEGKGKDEKPEDEKGDESEEKKDEESEEDTGEKDNGEEKGDDGSDSDNADGGDDSGSDNGGSDEGASDGGEKATKNNKKNGKGKDKDGEDGGSFKL